jgi:hypothetical protein
MGHSSWRQGLDYQTIQATGKKICGSGHYGIFNNIPAPEVYNVGGHMCMKIGVLFIQNLADGRGFNFFETSLDSTRI